MNNVQRNLYFINILLLLLILNFFLSNLACQIFETMRKIAYFSKKKKTSDKEMAFSGDELCLQT